MVHAGCGFWSGCCSWYGNDGDTVMLEIIPEESQGCIFVHYVSAQEGGPESDHFGVLRGAEDNMCEGGGRDNIF